MRLGAGLGLLLLRRGLERNDRRLTMPATGEEGLADSEAGEAEADEGLEA